MKPGIVAALICIMAASAIRADDDTFSLFGAIGAGFGMGGRLYTSTTLENGNTQEKDHFFNYGNGMKIDLGCRYFLMDDVALLGSFEYSAGIPKLEHKMQVIGSQTTTEYGFHMFGIKVCVAPRFEVLDLIDMYTGAGIGFFWNARSFETKNSTLTTIVSEYSGKITSAPTLGFVGLLGADYPMNDKITLFGEIAFEQVRFNLKRYVIEKSTDANNSTGTTYYSEDDSNNLPPEKVPGSNWQLRFGVRFALISD